MIDSLLVTESAILVLQCFSEKSGLLLLQNNIALSQKSNKCNIMTKQTEKNLNNLNMFIFK